MKPPWNDVGLTPVVSIITGSRQLKGAVVRGKSPGVGEGEAACAVAGSVGEALASIDGEAGGGVVRAAVAVLVDAVQPATRMTMSAAAPLMPKS